MESSSSIGQGMRPEHAALAREWKRLSRAATVVAVLTSPALLLTFITVNDWPLIWALVATFFAVVAFRGLIDVLAHWLIPRPSLFGSGEKERQEDAMQRRRRWWWRGKFRLVVWIVVLGFLVLVAMNLLLRIFGQKAGLFETIPVLRDLLASAGPSLIILGLQLPLFLIFNFLILFAPMLAFGIMQMKAYEPGDADWGVKLDDVRGQKEPKEDVERIITLWQSGEDFRKAGGKPERGLLLIGAPGTGKTMLSKAIATSFNSPIMTMPGSGFAATFIGMDVATVMVLMWRAKRMAKKWGGQCMIFIDEIDAVGMRRQALQGQMSSALKPPERFEDLAFWGPRGALTSSEDLILESREWRERMFMNRREMPRPVYPPAIQRAGEHISNFIFPGGMGMGGGSLALNQLLVQMDGMDNPPFMRKFFTKRINTFLDAMYVIPAKVGKVSLRLRPPKPRKEQLYFIGATNVPIDALDPALIRPGRLGRHIWFRTPTADDRKDIFDLYLAKVAHEDDLDGEKRRDELARITNGYSPAMIEQVCSMALTYAHSDGRHEFGWQDIVEAMTTIESGTAQNIEYVAEETRATAIHEAGHAIASHVYMHDVLSTRLSIRKRGGSLGHHQAIEKEERFSSWRHEEVGKLVWTLGAMAAEHVFYGENSRGVSGDVQSATGRAAFMVGVYAMGPEPINLNGRHFESDEERHEAEEKVMKRFEDIGQRIINRVDQSSMGGADIVARILSDPVKKASAARILGQAYITALCLVRHNREQTLEVADVLVERKELHGDEVVELLDSVDLEAPHIDVNDETIWPKL